MSFQLILQKTRLLEILEGVCAAFLAVSFDLQELLQNKYCFGGAFSKSICQLDHVCSRGWDAEQRFQRQH